MFIIAIISLSLLAAGIFFVPLPILAGGFGGLAVVDTIFAKDRKGFFKTAALLCLTVVPVALVKLLTVKEGVEIPFFGLKLYSEGLTRSGVAALRVFDLFLLSYLFLKVLFPLEKYQEKYGKVYFFRVVFESLELFPELLKPLKEIFKSSKSPEGRKGLAERLVRATDEVYVSRSNIVDDN